MKRAPLLIASFLLLTLLLAGCCAHDWQAATCKTPKTCAKCGETEGEALGHEWREATCSEPKTCALCGKTVGTTLEHEAGEWEIEAEADYCSPGLRALSCIYCGETMEEEEYYLPVYENSEFVLSANALASLCEEAWDGAVECAVEDGAVCVLFSMDNEPVARAVFLEADGELASVDDPEEAVYAEAIAISAAEDEEAYRLVLQAVISACRNEPIRTEADKLLANIGYALATGDLYSADGVSYFWGSYDNGAALYISVGDGDLLYEQRAIIPYFDFSFEEFVEMFNAAPEDINGGWTIERLDDGSFALRNLGGNVMGYVIGLDYAEEKFEANDGVIAREQFNELVIGLIDSVYEDEDAYILYTIMVGGFFGMAADESFNYDLFFDEYTDGLVKRGAFQGNRALVCETDACRHMVVQDDGRDMYLFIIQKLQG